MLIEYVRSIVRAPGKDYGADGRHYEEHHAGRASLTRPGALRGGGLDREAASV